MIVKSDIEIARAAKMKPIMEIGKNLGIPEVNLIQYGHTKAKVHLDFIDTLAKKKDGKLILVTAISPTPAGEGTADLRAQCVAMHFDGTQRE